MQKYFPTLSQAFVLLLQMIAISLIATIPYVFFSYLADLYKASVPIISSNLESFGFLITYVITLLWIIKIAQKRIKKTENQKLKWDFKRIPFQLVFIFIIMAIAVVLVVDPITAYIPMPETFKQMFATMVKPNLFSFLAVVIAAPLLEELFFRGIILKAFLKNYSVKKAIFWSAFIFGMAHLNPWQFIGAFVIGLLIGWAYYKTGSLIPGIIMHLTGNLLSFITLVITKDASLTLFDLFSDKLIYFVLLALSSLILFIGIFAVINRHKYINSKTTE